MTTLTPSALLDSLNFRYATKQFDPAKKIDPAAWAALEESLVLTPSSFGLQPWKFLVVTDAAVRESLVPHAWNQRQVADASHLVVMAVRKTVDEAYIDQFLARIAEVRSIPVESLAGYRGMMVGCLGMMTPDWAAKQAYIALGQFMLAAATLGVDTCPMEGFIRNPRPQRTGPHRRRALPRRLPLRRRQIRIPPQSPLGRGGCDRAEIKRSAFTLRRARWLPTQGLHPARCRAA
jgi:nitroreductase